MEIDIRQPNQWFTERCIVCDSVNHIFLDTGRVAFAWECYCCMNCWWLDDLERVGYMAIERIDYTTAEKHLSEHKVPVLHGAMSP